MVIFEQCNLSTILGSNMVNKYGTEWRNSLQSQITVWLTKVVSQPGHYCCFPLLSFQTNYPKSDDFTDQTQSKEG